MAITTWRALAVAAVAASGAACSSAQGGSGDADGAAGDGDAAGPDGPGPDGGGDGGDLGLDAQIGGDAGSAAAGLLLFGGFDGDNALADTWRWDGSQWRALALEVAPSPRFDHTMVFDRHRDRAVVYGGITAENEFLTDTWEFDGDGWKDVSPGDAPPARVWHAMAYDEARERIILFGGTTTGDDYLGDTWAFDGASWLDVTPGAGPSPARHSHQMAYDPNRESVLLFGGQDAGFDRPDDLWEWDGTSWSEIELSGEAPRARTEHAMASDRGRARVLVAGGLGDFDGDTWEWDGERFSEVTPIDGEPGPRAWHAMAYDPARGRVALFGGTTGSSTLVQNDTWMWSGLTWEIVASGTAAPPARRFHAMSAAPLP